MKSIYSFKKFLLTGILLTIFSLGWSQTLLVENFDYTSGAPLLDDNWLIQQTSTTNPLTIADGGLIYDGYSGSAIGNALAMMNTGQDAFRGFEKQKEGVLYMSVLVNISAATTVGDYFISFKESSTSTTNTFYRGRLWAMKDASDNLALGISKGSGTVVYTDFTYSLNTTYLLVLKYTFNSGADDDDVCDLFINPVIGDTEPLPTVTATDVQSDGSGLGSVLIRQGGSTSGATLTVDGIRVAQSWAHALPEMELFISEVADPADNANARFVELFNSGATTIDLTAANLYLSRQSNGGTTWGDVQITGTVDAGKTFVLGLATTFEAAYGFAPDQVTSILSSNGDDAYFIYKGGDHTTGTLFDVYGALDTDGTGLPWEFLDGRAERNFGVNLPNTIWSALEWTVTMPTNVAGFNPGVHAPVADALAPVWAVGYPMAANVSLCKNSI
ncbi:MAG: hypothetical protein K9H49_16115 [Bacteroidales bacterium]|nr:hypothetical protein [Bacteroidales bacterium]MCF8392242.1 hypothetical protein [Bacteroidales bacterium]